MEDELLFLWRSTSVFDPVSVEAWSLLYQGWEPLFSLLTCVEPVPAVIYDSIESVIEAYWFVTCVVADITVMDIEWLRWSIHSVIIETINDQYTELVLADVSIPGRFEFAIVFSCENAWSVWFSIVRDDLECIASEACDWAVDELSLFNSDNNVVQASASEFNATVFPVGPCLAWWWIMNDGFFGYIFEPRVLKLCKGSIVTCFLPGSESVLLCVTTRLGWRVPVNELQAVVCCLTSHCRVTHLP